MKKIRRFMDGKEIRANYPLWKELGYKHSPRHWKKEETESKYKKYLIAKKLK